MAKRTTEPKATERELLLLLGRRHARQGNGGSGEYAFLTHVRNDGGFAANRTFDAVSVSLWPSRGYEIHVFEVKVSRSDWLRELKDPAKSNDAWALGDRYSIVATAGVVDPAELPAGWGLVEAYGAKLTDQGLEGRKLRTVRAADYHGPKTRAPERTISRGLLVAMLRRAGAVPDQETPSEKVLRAAEDRGRTEAEAKWREVVDQAHKRRRDVEAQVQRFTSLSGVPVLPRYSQDAGDVDAMARRIRDALADDGHQDRVRANLKRLREQLAGQVDYLDRALSEIAGA